MDATPSQTIGPFFHICLAREEMVGRLAGPGAEGEPVQLICWVFDGDGVPVDDALVELWQADASGVYNHPDDPRYADHDPAFPGFARSATDAEGQCTFHTIKPGSRGEAPHINVSGFGRGLLKRVVTRIYFENDPANGADPVLALVPVGRRKTLLARQDAVDPTLWRFEIHLCGQYETVFFEF